MLFEHIYIRHAWTGQGGCLLKFYFTTRMHFFLLFAFFVTFNIFGDS